MTLNLTLTHLFFDSMHDNRWEGEKEEDKEKEDKTKREEKPKKKEKEEEKAKPPTSQKVKGGSSGILMQVTLLVM